ncbi:MAG: pyridoxamine kinase [Clostridia bacterium]|nr:pyridoxamine kinase [Clostridia bacterium]
MNCAQRLPRAAAIHDISGFGKCSLTVALPILSACGVEAACMPTAVLSTHTGGIKGYTFRDLTEDMRAIWQHWKSLGIPFDAIYSGYMGSVEQTEIIGEMFDAFRKDTKLILVDPAMADNGKFYAMFDARMAQGQAALCARADVAVPNLTDAALMTGQEYHAGPYTESYLRDMCRRLCDLGAKNVVLTGARYHDGQLGACCYQGEKEQFDVYFTQRVQGSYHGTGDVYASVLTAALLNDFSLPEGMQLAADFVYECLERTRLQETDSRYGVDFERGLPRLGMKMMRMEAEK